MPSRPMLKRSIPYFTADDAIHFRLAGNLISLEDPDGKVLALLKLLDGTREPAEICLELQARYPDLTAGDVREAIADLDESRLIQDSGDVGQDFDADAHERWSRNFGFFETYASLDTSTLDLVAVGFTDVRILDFDTVELSNLNRQVLYGERFIGQPKVAIAAERARDFNSGIHLEAEQARLDSADDVYRVVHDRDIVIGTADNPKLDIEHWLNEGCVRAGAALISGGVVTQCAFLSTIVPGVSGCLRCCYDAAGEDDPTTRMVRQDLLATQARGERFAEDYAAFNGLVVLLAAQMVGEAVRLASRVTPPLTVGRLIEMSFDDPRPQVTESFKRRDDCPVCQDAEPAKALRWLSSDTRPLPF